MARSQASPTRALRVALLWDDTVVDERELAQPAAIALGAGRRALFPLPEGVVPDGSLILLEPHAGGYRLRLSSQLGGVVWIGGERRVVAELARRTAHVPLGPDDYGILTVGPVAVFFQHVRPARRPARPLFGLDGELAAGLGLSAFLFGALLLVAFMDLRERPPEDPLELPADLITKYMVVPPPEDLFEQTSPVGTEVEDVGLRGREEAGGERHDGDEGRVGQEDSTRPDTHIEGDVTDRVTAKVRHMGLLGALSGGGEGNAIAAALDAPTVSDILGGMGVGPTVVGHGSRGAGLRGSGRGGGGDGPGSLFGAGELGTGIGAGPGGGTGRGRGGAGAPDRRARERKITVTSGRPDTTGRCSPDQINRVVRTNQAAVRYCYDVEVQRQPDLRGRAEFTWRINGQGGVTSVRVGRSTLGSPRVEGCIVRQVRRWRFPEPEGGECLVTYPFLFGVEGG